MNPIFQLVADQFPTDATPAAARIAGPEPLADLCCEVAHVGAALRPVTLTKKTALRFQGQDPANQPQATRGIIRLLELRPDLAALTQVDPDALAAVAQKDEAYDFLANTMLRVVAAVDDALLVLRAAEGAAAAALAAAVKRRFAELAEDPAAQTALLARFGPLEQSAQKHKERDHARRQHKARRQHAEDAAHAEVATARPRGPGGEHRGEHRRDGRKRR